MARNKTVLLRFYEGGKIAISFHSVMKMEKYVSSTVVLFRFQNDMLGASYPNNFAIIVAPT